MKEYIIRLQLPNRALCGPIGTKSAAPWDKIYIIMTNLHSFNHGFLL